MNKFADKNKRVLMYKGTLRKSWAANLPGEDGQ